MWRADVNVRMDVVDREVASGSVARSSKMRLDLASTLTFRILMSPTKRKLDDVENDHAAEPTPKKLILEQHDDPRTRLGEMKYPRVDSKNAIQAPPFQYPFQLVSFSYTPERVLEFNNKALKYYIDPPIGADLTYRIDNWIRRPEDRGRLDGLLKACLQDQVTPELRRATVVSWRGVMTK